MPQLNAESKLIILPIFFHDDVSDDEKLKAAKELSDRMNIIVTYSNSNNETIIIGAEDAEN